MRKQLLAGVALALALGFGSCKKDDGDSIRSKVIGKWRVDKIETSGSLVSSENGSVSYQATDYIDFKNNESDDVEQSLNGERTVGSYTLTVGDGIFIDFTTDDLNGSITEITGSKMTFKATVAGSEPTVTKIYYLSR